jgi:hypothetical protein
MKVAYYISKLKKGIKIKECTCICTHLRFNKIITVDRNEEFISEIISTLV